MRFKGWGAADDKEVDDVADFCLSWLVLPADDADDDDDDNDDDENMINSVGPQIKSKLTWNCASQPQYAKNNSSFQLFCPKCNGFPKTFTYFLLLNIYFCILILHLAQIPVA